MPLYESTFIARHDMSTQQVEGLAESFANIIKENGGEVAKTEFWGLKSLAYRIKKNRKGHYIFFNLDAPSAAVHEFERNLRLNEDILRYLTVRVDELDPEPSAMMQARASRDDRSRRGGGRPRDGESHGDQPKPAAKESEGDQAKTAAKDAGEPANETLADSDAAKSDDAPKLDDDAESHGTAKSDAAAKPDDDAGKSDDAATPDDAAAKLGDDAGQSGDHK